MLLKRNEIRSIRSDVGYNGMILYTPDQEQVCIAYDANGDTYTLRNEPAIFWKEKEDSFHYSYYENNKKEATYLLIRVILEFIAPIIIVGICTSFNLLTPSLRAGIYFFLFSFGSILENSILIGLKRRKSMKGIFLLKWRGALNMALNAFEKKHYPPTLDEIKKYSIYRINRDYHINPGEILALFFLFLAMAFFMPSKLALIVAIPILIFLFWLSYKTALFGVLRLTYVATPDVYELKMARDLIEFWYSVSYLQHHE